jgi:hypothetical protein
MQDLHSFKARIIPKIRQLSYNKREEEEEESRIG